MSERDRSADAYDSAAPPALLGPGSRASVLTRSLVPSGSLGILGADSGSDADCAAAPLPSAGRAPPPACSFCAPICPTSSTRVSVGTTSDDRRVDQMKKQAQNTADPLAVRNTHEPTPAPSTHTPPLP